VLDPAGNVIVSVYSSGAIGRLVPDDVVGLVRHRAVELPRLRRAKRSLRERPRLRSFGVEPGTVRVEEDWHAGSRTDVRSLRDLNRLWPRPVK
jgi:hypothetical protein